ncbi:uncharacterized protein UV8b_04780 [Ustilaginoidea virens]|uniref:Uncharacterized protein n=1 Tax=Ustilaginoidea virens TaxID=1159556 RepID=A0A1B5KX26_USTVR|nr:uncharacterized protein UV8b_04780 [Ustilaginoidea virens]QUC20539.1 hypothetical protein UV8b_04780 [Ustilaginoidea virens]GAO15606.1 hypothetical protein UVI_02050380 [Ustilaginoidea virens]
MPPPLADRKSRTREHYPFLLDYRTRWNDNDMYNHMNNSVYDFLFDSAVNAYLLEHCGLDPRSAPQHPVVVRTSTDYCAPIAYPAVAEVGVRVARLGRSSVAFELGLFEQGVGGVKAVCDFVHVFVDRATGRPAAAGMAPHVRRGLEKLCRGEEAADGRSRL